MDKGCIMALDKYKHKDTPEGESCIDAGEAFGSVAFFEYVYVDGKKMPIDEVFKPVVTYSDNEDDTEETDNMEK